MGVCHYTPGSFLLCKFQLCIRISVQLTLQELLKFIALLNAVRKNMSLRASAHTGVAIPIDFRVESANLMGVATPFCGMARDDSLFITAR